MKDAVLVVSAINVDVIHEVDRLPAEHEKLHAKKCIVAGGGSGANTAYWLSKLGTPVCILGFVGRDVFGDFALAELEAAGIDVSACVRLEGRATNIVSIFSTAQHKSMVSAGISYGEDDAAALMRSAMALDWRRIRHIHFATCDKSLIERLMDATGAKGVSLSIDLDGFYDAGVVRRAGIVFSNMEEVARAAATERPASFLARTHATDKIAFLITDGAHGAKIISQGRIVEVGAARVEPVDRTGGGDAFDAGALTAYLRGESLELSAAKGLALASHVIRGWGARPNVDPAVLRSISADMPGGR